MIPVSISRRLIITGIRNPVLSRLSTARLLSTAQTPSSRPPRAPALIVAEPSENDLKPRFTTPIETTPEEYLNEDLSKPLKPTDLPVEDYASPLLHTANTFATLFRYTVYGSVTIVLLSLGAFAGVHLWVEKVELAGDGASKSSTGADEEDQHMWGEELDGWSGGHLGGGTDPRLGIRARMAIRSAWIGQSWGAGITASPVSPSPSSSPFGGAMIGTQSHVNVGRAVPDAGWQMAENYLVYAISRAEQKGISLLSPEEKVDRTALELEERLAGVRERMGGRFKLEEARAGWERVYHALSSTGSPSPWEQREKVRATKRLGEISARLADLEEDGSEFRNIELGKAEGWLVGGLVPVLSTNEGIPPNFQIEKSTKSVSPSSSFFGFWSRSHPPSHPNSSVTADYSDLKPALSNLLRLVDQATIQPTLFDPATSRTILTSLLSLETHLARSRNLPAAAATQRSALSFAQSLHSTPEFSPSPTSGGPNISQIKLDSADSSSFPWSKRQWTSTTLAQLSLLARSAILSTHLAEVSLAQGKNSPEPEALARLQGAINDCDVVLSVLDGSPLLSPLPTGLRRVFSLRSSGKDLDSRKAASAVVRDARLTGSMAARLTAYVHEAGCGSLAIARAKAKGGRVRKSNWCGGDASAEAFYAKAMEFSLGEPGKEKGNAKAKPKGKSEKVKVWDEKGYLEAEKGFIRTRGSVLKNEDELVGKKK
ncbi:hypothetical protein T439DRAFT_323050 [Meredithblackwellia eburnea MCA 4105]